MRRPLSEAISADRWQAARVSLSNEANECLGHSEGTVVKADIAHFTLLIKLLLLKLIYLPLLLPCVQTSKVSTRGRQGTRKEIVRSGTNQTKQSV